MSDDPAKSSGQQGADPSPFKPHKFRRDPLEGLKLALRGRTPRGRVVAVSAVALLSVGLIGATMLGSGGQDAAASIEAQTKRLAELDANVKQREAEVENLERRRADAAAAIADSSKRIATLETKRSDLQRQVAELTAPVAPVDEVQDEAAAPRPAAGEPTGSRDGASLAAVTDDPSPSGEDTAEDSGRLSASSRSTDDAAAPSTARVEQASAEAPAAHASGPVRVFIHIRSADPAARERARAVAAELERRGVTVAEIRGVLRPVSQDSVRFYYDADREAVSTLRDAVRQASPSEDAAPRTQDFRGYRAPPHQGTLELWLS